MHELHTSSGNGLLGKDTHMFDRFDIAEAWYLFLTHYHGGQWSRGYMRLSRMTRYFKPRMSLDYDTLTDNGQMIYDALVDRAKNEKHFPN